MNRLFDFVMNTSDEEFKTHINEYLSLDACLNYYIMTDMAYLLDNLGKNMLLATYDGNVWYPCLYDLDTAWGTNERGDGLLKYEQYLVGFDYTRLFERIEQCFPDKLSQRYFELRQDVLSRNNILFKFNGFKNLIPETAFARELLKWGPVLPGYGTSQIETFLDNMIPRLDNKYNNMKIKTDNAEVTTDNSETKADDSEITTDNTEAKTDDSETTTDNTEAKTDDSETTD